MRDTEFFITDDNSIGLYSKSFGDIFHSRTGALKEAREKFINPVIESKILEKKSELNILDICSGVGYNLKCAIKYFTGKKLYIDCIEKNKNYILISPFINDSLNDIDLEIEILNNIIKNGYSLYEIYELIKNTINEENMKFFSASMTKMAEFIINSCYINSLSPQNNRFLHNIYYFVNKLNKKRTKLKKIKE